MIWHTASPLLIEKALPEELCDDLLCYIKDSASRPRTFQGELNETLRKSDYVEMDRDLERRVFTSTRHILVTSAPTCHLSGNRPSPTSTGPVPGSSPTTTR